MNKLNPEQKFQIGLWLAYGENQRAKDLPEWDYTAEDILSMVEDGAIPEHLFTKPLTNDTLFELGEWVAKNRDSELPEGIFSLENKKGFTVAHVAASHGYFDFSESQMKWGDDEGLTVAHMMAVGGHADFSDEQIGMMTATGVTVAHFLATNRCAAKVVFSEDVLGITNKDGLSVRDLLEKHHPEHPSLAHSSLSRALESAENAANDASPALDAGNNSPFF